MVVAILLSGIGGAFGYVAPMIIQRALDLAIPDKNEKLLFSLVGMLVGIYVVSVIFTTIRSRIMVDVSQNIIYDIRKDLFEHLQELPFQYYDDRPHGKILIRVVNYVNSVSDMLSNGLINIVLECFNLLFIVIFMFLVDVQMALVVLCGVPVLCVFMVWIKNKQRRAWQAVSNKNSNLNAYLQENIVGARITQIFAREDENAKISFKIGFVYLYSMNFALRTEDDDYEKLKYQDLNVSKFKYQNENWEQYRRRNETQNCSIQKYIVERMRNSLMHGHIEILLNKKGEVEFVFRDKYNKRNEVISIILEDLEEFLSQQCLYSGIPKKTLIFRVQQR